MANVVLVESYYGGSPRAWADSWVESSRHNIALVTHPDQFWRWRLRGGAVTLAQQFDEHVGLHGRPDAVVVSGMVDVAAFSGLARRSLGNTPLAVYVHESQLLYPLAPNQRSDSSSALINWQSLAAADAVWFNSAFHRDALRQTLPGLLKSQPTPSHLHLIEPVFERSTVLWPGVHTEELLEAQRPVNVVPRVLWNQRWDHDKNPRAVFAALLALAREGVEFTLALAGERQNPDKSAFADLLDPMADRIDHRGFVPDAEYHPLLVGSDVVVSAADHEFFGIAIVEAIAAGATPVLPDRLSFPELIEPQWHEHVLYSDGALRSRLRQVLADVPRVRAQTNGLRQSMSRFSASHAAHSHDAAVDRLLNE